jgi:hypothetical protein
MISYDSDIPIIWHCKRVVPRSEILLFPRRRVHEQNRQISETCKKKMASKSVCCTSTVALPPATSSTSAIKLQKTQKRTLMTLNQQIKKDIQTEYCSD